LNAEGIPTLTGNWNEWYATTVAGQLRNPLYVGRVVLNGEDFPGDHERIIDEDSWRTACDLREATKALGRPRGRRTAGQHLLTEGLLRCTCGAAMSPITRRDTRGYDYAYEAYTCMTHLHQHPDPCPQKSINR
jgi:site-specific DNA recombinase